MVTTTTAGNKKDWDGLFHCYKEHQHRYESVSEFLSSELTKTFGVTSRDLRTFFLKYEAWLQIQNGMTVLTTREQKLQSIRAPTIRFIASEYKKHKVKPSYAEIHQEALRLAAAVPIPKFKASDGWVAKIVKEANEQLQNDYNAHDDDDKEQQQQQGHNTKEDTLQSYNCDNLCLLAQVAQESLRQGGGCNLIHNNNNNTTTTTASVKGGDADGDADEDIDVDYYESNQSKKPAARTVEDKSQRQKLKKDRPTFGALRHDTSTVITVNTSPACVLEQDARLVGAQEEHGRKCAAVLQMPLLEDDDDGDHDKIKRYFRRRLRRRIDGEGQNRYISEYN